MGRTVTPPCCLCLFMMLTLTYGQQQPQKMSASGLIPDLGDNFPKLSIDCMVEFAKYGQPLVEMASNSTVKLNQETLMKLLQSPIGESKFLPSGKNCRKISL